MQNVISKQMELKRLSKVNTISIFDNIFQIYTVMILVISLY